MKKTSFGSTTCLFVLAACTTLVSVACDELSGPAVVKEKPGTGGSDTGNGSGGSGPTTGGTDNPGSGGQPGGEAGAGGSDPNSNLPPRQRVLDEVARCSQAIYSANIGPSQELLQALTTYAASLQEPERVLARSAWQKAMIAWQQAEVFQMGPAGVSGVVVGGRDLRDHIYSWPLVNLCGVDQLLVSKAYELPAFAERPINVRGLAAIEYLLFNENPAGSCDPTHPIHQDGSWAKISPEEFTARKANYARAAAEIILARGTELSQAWASTGGNFASELRNAGRGGHVYASEQAGLNAISDALFYVEKEVKDLKLGKVVGLGDCGKASCPEAAESRFAGIDEANLLQNLAGFRKIFAGCGAGGAGYGFEDLLRELGAVELADNMKNQLDAAEQAVHLLRSRSLAQVQTEEPATVRAIYDSLKKLTDLLKTQFVTVLDLELPKRTEGDND